MRLTNKRTSVFQASAPATPDTAEALSFAEASALIRRGISTQDPNERTAIIKRVDTLRSEFEAYGEDQRYILATLLSDLRRYAFEDAMHTSGVPKTLY